MDPGDITGNPFAALFPSLDHAQEFQHRSHSEHKQGTIGMLQYLVLLLVLFLFHYSFHLCTIVCMYCKVLFNHLYTA